MAQRKQLTWTELRVGVFVLACMFILALGIFYVTGAGSLAPKYEVHTFLPEVENLQVGAPVTLDGLEVGNVARILLNTHGDKEHNLEVVMRIQRRFQPYIRESSEASLVTQGVLGNRYVSITRGYSGNVIPPNGEVPGTQVAEIKDVVQRGADLVQNLGVLSEDVQDVVNAVKQGEGTLGKLITDPSLYNHLDDTAARADAMVASVQRGQGTIGKLITTEDVYNKADSAVGRADSLLADVQQQKGTLGKLVEDPAVYNQARDFMSRGSSLFAGIQEGKGTLGKLATDETLYTNLRDASANVRDASAKLNSNTNTMGKFFTDPRLYDNLTGLTGDTRLLISDFRKNPKKFLHVKFSIF
jgi:phospholipid/cholesterol/gamma-HCH transport system substrate-binding protein